MSALRPRLIVIAGPNGSGKTSITHQLHDLRHKWMVGCDYINPDDIAERELNGWNDQASVLTAARLATERREACLREGRDFAFETVFSTQEKLDFLFRAHQAGFFIRLFFVGTDSPTINAKRVAARYLQGGHAVPIDKIVNRYARSMTNAGCAATFVDRAYFYDNSTDVAPGEEPDWDGRRPRGGTRLGPPLPHRGRPPRYQISPSRTRVGRGSLRSPLCLPIKPSRRRGTAKTQGGREPLRAPSVALRLRR